VQVQIPLLRFVVEQLSCATSCQNVVVFLTFYFLCSRCTACCTTGSGTEVQGCMCIVQPELKKYANLGSKTNVFRAFCGQKRLWPGLHAPDLAGGGTYSVPQTLSWWVGSSLPPSQNPHPPLSAFGLDLRLFGPQTAPANSIFGYANVVGYNKSTANRRKWNLDINDYCVR